MAVDLLVPIKPLARAKTRLRDAADDGAAHARLVVALARDTLAAAAAAALVRRVVAVCSDGLVRRILAMDGVEAVADEPGDGLNSALRYGEALLRCADPATAVAARTRSSFAGSCNAVAAAGPNRAASSAAAGHDDLLPGVQLLDDTWVVPWFEGAAPITSATIGRVSGQKRNAQRIDIPPWL